MSPHKLYILVTFATCFSLCHCRRQFQETGDFMHQGSDSRQNVKYMHQDDAQNHATDGKFGFASYFSSNMVLQSAPQQSSLWGYAPLNTIGQSVKISFVGNSVNDDYFATIRKGPFKEVAVWNFTLNAINGGGPYVITAILTGFTPILLEDVLFGDVWICSGQSNMQFTMTQMYRRTWFIEQGLKYRNVRLLNVQRVTSEVPLYDFKSLIFKWIYPGYGDSNGKPIPWQDTFSSVCFMYGKYLYDGLKFPIGLIDSTWGGTPVEAWSSPEALSKCGLYGKGGMNEQEYKRLLERDPFAASSPSGVPTNNSVLWNAMIHPMLNMSIMGAIWYQGESNTEYHTDLYSCTFPAMVKDWIDKFVATTNRSTILMDMPFGFVQIGPNAKPTKSAEFGYPQIRWHQMGDNATNLPMESMFMAVAMDLTDTVSPYGAVHIRDKDTVAHRLSHAALNNFYRQAPTENDYLYPTYLSLDKTKKTMLLQFGCGVISLEIKTYDGFEVCCSEDYSKCPMNSTVNWVQSPITKYNETTLWISWEQCTTSTIAAYRYAWRETPCSYQYCAVYSDYSGDPLPTYMQKITDKSFFDCPAFLEKQRRRKLKRKLQSS